MANAKSFITTNRPPARAYTHIECMNLVAGFAVTGCGLVGGRERWRNEETWHGYGRRFNSLFDFRRNLCCKLLIRFSCKRIQKSYFTFGLFFVPLFRTFWIWLPNRFCSFPMVLLRSGKNLFFFLTLPPIFSIPGSCVCVCVSSRIRMCYCTLCTSHFFSALSALST